MSSPLDGPVMQVALRTAELAMIPYAPTESDHDRATEAATVRRGGQAPWRGGQAPWRGLRLSDFFVRP